ncbi:MAG: PilZ domain-containing protein [candidate division NC10 bacterium]
MEKRQHSRFVLRMPVLCESPMVRDYRTLGITRNVSQSGLLVEAVLPLPQGTSTDLRLLSGDLVARAEAVVVWAAEGSPGLMGLPIPTYA